MTPDDPTTQPAPDQSRDGSGPEGESELVLGPGVTLTPDGRPRQTIRTFTPRWRNSPLTDERMEQLLPTFDLPEGPLDAATAFGSEMPVVLEIGSGHGAAAIAYALAHPDHGIIAAEVHVPGVARMMAAAQEAGATNLRVHVGDAILFLTDDVPTGSLAGVHLFFPDPWHKKRHAKRRFVQQHTLDLVRDRLAPDGVLRIATDIAAYAEHSLEQLERHGGFDVTVGPRPQWRPTDGFEDKGIAAGRTITDITARPR
ncbi:MULTISPECIES: tRNA (guanosine(46)-N7)-methyltransferase TrmB [unclassified Janibacter]|uniref:tRNA (guanosine(46)-N7)-methyltransferase TrmB n=1 Tax=unclassified Janibacter TaxID=2649294 RepID=UPI003CFD4C7E